VLCRRWRSDRRGVFLNVHTVSVRLLGPMDVRVGGRPIAVVGSRRRVLLALLAVAAPAPLPAETLGGRLWPDLPPASTRKKVQTLVVRLRQDLEVDAIERSPGGYRLRCDDLDIAHFDNLLSAAARADEPAVERDLLAAALDLWRGDPFDGVECGWLLDQVAPRLTERYLAAIARRIELDLAAGRHAESIAELRVLTGRYPLHEAGWGQLLKALNSAGRPTEALAAYADVRGLLATELGIEPGPELQGIYRGLLQADAERQPSQFVPQQLPQTVRRFVGRGAELAALDEPLPASQFVCATIVGGGGVGKTALALRWAHRVRQEFGDGQLYLDLRGFGTTDPLEPAAALEALLRSLGFSADQIPRSGTARARALHARLSGKRTLVVLDNVRDVDQLRPLLPGFAGVRAPVLITSRNRLRDLNRLACHRTIELGTMSSQEAVDVLTGALDETSYPRHSAELAELARLCGHLPLALAIAGERLARQPWATTSELIDQLTASRPRLDAFDSPDDPTTSLRTVFSWSYHALDSNTAHLFRMLGHHTGPDITARTAAALARTDEPEAARSLNRLADEHLLIPHAPTHFELPALLRNYALELSTPPQTRQNSLPSGSRRHCQRPPS
jgi:DNA-binding SARP family transcriptional activator